MSIPILSDEQHWECPNCDAWGTSTGPQEPQFHNCPGLGGLSAPFVLAGTKAKVEAREREDYVNGELVQTNAEGRPIMSIVTTRDEGQDCVVLAPTATLRGEASGLG